MTAVPIVLIDPFRPRVRRKRNRTGINNPTSPYSAVTRIRVSRYNSHERLTVTGYRVMLKGAPLLELVTIVEYGSAQAAYTEASRQCYQLNHDPKTAENGRHYVIPLNIPSND